MLQQDFSGEMLQIRNGLIFESIVLFVLILLLVIVGNYNRKKKSKLTKLLLYIFLSYTLAMFFSWLAKLLYIIMDISSLEQLFPNISGYYFYKLIFKYRLAFSFIGIGAYLNYIFEIKVFKKKADKKYLLAFKIYVVFFFLFNIIFIPAENEFLDIISFGLMFILMLVVYLPFIYRNLRLSRRIEQGAYKNGLISLGVMGIFFILISVNMLADRAMIIFFDSSGYTFFYYAGWSSTIFAVLSAYYGFIRPAAYKKK